MYRIKTITHLNGIKPSTDICIVQNGKESTWSLVGNSPLNPDEVILILKHDCSKTMLLSKSSFSSPWIAVFGGIYSAKVIGRAILNQLETMRKNTLSIYFNKKDSMVDKKKPSKRKT